MKFTAKNPHYEYLRKKWAVRHRSLQDKLWEKHGGNLRGVALGSISGLLLLSSPQQAVLLSGGLAFSSDDALKGFDQNVLLADSLKDFMPPDVRLLDEKEEIEITDLLSKNFGFKVTASIDNIKLNRNYGVIGGEQHLYRYPGDNLYAHADNAGDWAKYGGAGIAPGLGAWGYFAPTKQEFTDKDKGKEKYYLAIQTFLVPGYAENVSKYRVFFKYRKMIVVNPKTGQTVVAVIGDAGPAEWTGKHLGGSPEVMDYLGLAAGPRKGPVLYFFIDDPEDKIPLGPVKVKTQA